MEDAGQRERQAEALENVLDYMPTCDILNARFVSHDWSNHILLSERFPPVIVHKKWDQKVFTTPFDNVQYAKTFWLQGVRILRHHERFPFWNFHWPIMERNLTSLTLFHIDILCWKLAELINECVNVKTLNVIDIKFDHEIVQPDPNINNHDDRRSFCQHVDNPIIRIHPPTITKLVLQTFKSAIFPNCVHLLLAARCDGVLKDFEYSNQQFKNPATRANKIPSTLEVDGYAYNIIRQNAATIERLSLEGNTNGHELLMMIHAQNHLHPLRALDSLELGQAPNLRIDNVDHLPDFFRFIEQQQRLRPLQALKFLALSVREPHIMQTMEQTMAQCTSLKKLELFISTSNQPIPLNFLQPLHQLKHLTVCSPEKQAVFTADHFTHIQNLLQLRSFKADHDLSMESVALQAALRAVNCRFMTKLEITRAKIVTDVVFQAIIGRMTALEVLTINWAPKLTDSGLTGLDPALVQLVLKKKVYQIVQNAETMMPRRNGVNLKDQLRNLTTLNLKGCKQVSDLSLRHAIQSPILTKVDVGFLTNVTDLGLNWLCENNPQLREIECKHNRNITHYGLNFLMQRFSRLTDIHITKEIGTRTLGADLPYDPHPQYAKLVSVAKWNEIP